MTWYHGLIDDFLDKYPDTPEGDRRLADHVASNLSPGEARGLAADLLVGQVGVVRRARARETERSSSRSSSPRPSPQSAIVRSAEDWNERYPGVCPRNTVPWYNDWLQTEAGKAHQQALREIDNKFAREQEEISARHVVRMKEIMERFQAKVRLEVTAELLASTFALGDGVRVTWGEATPAQHEQRIELLVKNVNANLEAINRHKAAIDLIHENSAHSLGEIAEVHS